MRKGGNGNGVSQTGDDGMGDDALAAAMETDFAPFASRSRSVPVPVPHDDPRADAELDEHEDPEVTAITRRFDRTHDTLGAMNELEQLLIERTGQIPVVTPELLASHARRLERADAASEPGPWPEAAAEPAAEPAVDWTIDVPAPLDPAPGFSSWIDPAATAAAIDTAPREVTDVSTKVFAVFSADRPAAEPEAEPEPEPESATAPDPERTPEPAVEPTPEPEDELDGIDDLTAPPELVAAPTASVHPEPPPPAEERPRTRRFWPFGRR